MASLCLLVITQNLNAQSVTISNTNPNPTPPFTAPLTVDSLNGFTSNSTGVFNNFPKGKTTTITSPAYYYTTPQPVIYFKYSFTIATAGNTTVAAPQVSILAPGGPYTAIASSLVIANGTADYYFTFTPASLFPANTNFQISLTMAVANSDKAVAANTLTTNALLASGAAALPVNFAGFYARQANGGVALTWNVGVEENVSGYEVQKSADGSSFSKIGFVAASGQSSYGFVDSKSSGNVYYRIKSIDVDGQYKYSIVVSLKGQQSAVVMKAFPMPVQNQLTLQHSAAGSNSKIEIVSADGRMIQSVALTAGAQQSTLDLSSAKAGVYFVRLVNENNMQSLKIVKQ